MAGHSGMVLSLCRRMLRSQHDVEDGFQATFLTLVEKAATIGKRNSVGSWLRGTAFRIASNLRVRFARCQDSPLPRDMEAPCSEETKIQLWNDILTALTKPIWHPIYALVSSFFSPASRYTLFRIA